MADFRPTTTFYLCEDTRVTDGDQPFFTSEGAKVSWYLGHRTHTYSSYSYQRENREYIRIDEKASNLRNCDVALYKNDEAGRWFVCRIMSVEFINPNCAEVGYVVDPMQTFMEDIRWMPCWIEREMQEGDWSGGRPSFNNLMPEGLESGGLTRTPVSAPDLIFNSYKIVVNSIYDASGDPVVPHFEGKVMIPFTRLTTASASEVGTFLKALELKGKLNGVVSMFMCPSQLADSDTFETTIELTPNWNTIDGYTVVNAKCFSSEFYRLELSNKRGNKVELRPENFKFPASMSLSVQGAFLGGSGSVYLFPVLYEGTSIDHAVVLPLDTQIPWSGNEYANTAAQKNGAIAIQTVAAVIAGGVYGATFGNPLMAFAGAAAGAVQAAGSAMAALQEASVDPMGVGGQASGSNINITLGSNGFSVNWIHPNAPNVKSIDDFFSRFGYRTNRLKVPNVNTRPKWNYVKTAGATVAGPFSAKDRQAIEDQLDRGVTFWHVPAVQVGDYSDPAGNR